MSSSISAHPLWGPVYRRLRGPSGQDATRPAAATESTAPSLDAPPTPSDVSRATAARLRATTTDDTTTTRDNAPMERPHPSSVYLIQWRDHHGTIRYTVRSDRRTSDSKANELIAAGRDVAVYNAQVFNWGGPRRVRPPRPSTDRDRDPQAP